MWSVSQLLARCDRSMSEEHRWCQAISGLLGTPVLSLDEAVTELEKRLRKPSHELSHRNLRHLVRRPR
jgi:hypothetical protein